MKHTPAITPSTTPTLSDLAHILRHEELWPHGFEWHWANCHTCAMGLLIRTYNIDVGSPSDDDWMSTMLHASAKALGIDFPAAYSLFMTTTWFRLMDMLSSEYPTPEMVACGIDNFLASRDTPSHG